MVPSRVLVVVLFLITGLHTGCTGTREGAAEQLRSAISFDGVPEQYEPPVEEGGDDFEPDFDE